MGMFDSLYEGGPDDWAREWQTKAYHCNLDVYRVGDSLPWLGECEAYQVEILGGRMWEGDSRDSFATVRDDILASIDDERDPSLPRFNYSGHMVERGTAASDALTLTPAQPHPPATEAEGVAGT